MSTAAHERAYLSVSDVARMLEVAPTTVRRKIEAGELAAVQLGGPGSSVRVPRDGLAAWLDANPAHRGVRHG